MNTTELKKLLLEIPTQLCRNMDQQFVKSILKDLGINFSQQHYTVLRLLEESGPLYVTALVEILGITKSQMTALVDKLIMMEYVNRTNDRNDRRKIYISTTHEGKKAASEINTAIDKQIDNHLFKLNQKELETLENGLLILKKLCADCNNKIQEDEK